MKIDRDPKVVQAIEAARREIIARAYHEKTGDAASRPEADDIRKYYDANPALFKERRIYKLQEIAIEAEPAKIDELKARLQAAAKAEAFVDYLKTSGLRYRVQPGREGGRAAAAAITAVAAQVEGR